MINEAAIPETGPTTISKTRKSKTPQQKMIRPYANLSDIPSGQARYWCDACMESFLASEEPTQCQNGHRVDDPELNGSAGAAAQ